MYSLRLGIEIVYRFRKGYYLQESDIHEDMRGSMYKERELSIYNISSTPWSGCLGAQKKRREEGGEKKKLLDTAGIELRSSLNRMSSSSKDI